MRFTEFLAELRRKEKQKSPEPKYQELGHPAAIEYLKGRDLSKYVITMTDLPKVGVNPGSTYNTPLGIYFYPADYYVVVRGRVPFQADANYINILQLTTNKILYLNQMDTTSMTAALDKLKQLPAVKNLSADQNIDRLIKDADHKARKKSEPGKFWYVLWKLSNLLAAHNYKYADEQAHSVWNYLFRQLGYDVVIDQGESIIHENEPNQGFIVNPRGTYRLEKTINNVGRHTLTKKKLGYEENSLIKSAYNNSQREEAHLKLVNQDPYLISKMKNPSEAVQLAAVKKDPDVFGAIKNPSEAAQLAAVEQDGMILSSIDNPSEAVQMAAVTTDWQAIQYIRNPSEAVQMAAGIQKDPYVIRDVKNPSEQVQIMAVSKVGALLRDLLRKKKIVVSEKVVLAALNNDPEAIRFFYDPKINVHKIVPTREMILRSVNEAGYLIRFIPNPDTELQMAAVKNDFHSYLWIEDPDPAVTELYNKLKSQSK
jgi:hypothetical protein